MAHTDIFVGIVIGFVLGLAISNLILKAMAQPVPSKGMIYNYDANGKLIGIFPASVPEG